MGLLPDGSGDQPRGQANNIFDVRSLENPPNALRMQIGEGRLNQILFFKPFCMQNERFQGLQKLNLKRCQVVVLSDELFKGSFDLFRPG